MKIKSFDHALPYFLKPRIRGKGASGSIRELLTPEFEAEQIEGLMEDTLRWADDGGKMLDPGNLMARTNSELLGAVR